MQEGRCGLESVEQPSTISSSRPQEERHAGQPEIRGRHAGNNPVSCRKEVPEVCVKSQTPTCLAD